jgi:predicted permease
MMLRTIGAKAAALFRGRGLDEDLDAEIRTHLELAAEEYRRRGMTVAEAERAARRDFGNRERAREGHREARAFAGLEAIARDLRVGTRSLRKRPGFTAIAVLTLALGIGATSAVFSLVQGVLLTPPPYQEPDRLVVITPTRLDPEIGESPDWSAEQWLGWREESQLLETIGAYMWTFSFLVSDDGSLPIEGMRVTRDYFRATGLEPAIGRVFDATETGGAEAPAAILLGHELWMNRFGGDPSIVGQQVRLARMDEAPVVIGVMPPGVRFLPAQRSEQEPNYDLNATVDYWLPGEPTRASSVEILQQQSWSAVGRLAPGATVEAAQRDLALIATRQAQANPAYEAMRPELRAVPDVLNGDGRRILLPLLAAAALVFLIACGNVAALLLVRGLQRQREYGVRVAIGAGRRALLRLVTLESLLLAVTGGLIGFGIALLLVRGFKSVAGEAIPRLDGVSIGWTVLGFGLAAALVSALIAGVYPALRAWTHSEAGSLKEAGSRTSAGRAERRLLASLTVAQAALTLALLVGAGLLVRTMGNLATIDRGYSGEQVLTMAVTEVGDDWAGFHRLALERVSAIPGVEGAAFAWGVPLTGNMWRQDVEIEGSTSPAGGEVSLPMRAVTPGYFDIFGRTISAGRDFRPTDDGPGEVVAVVNDAFVKRYFDGASPLGRTVTVPNFGDAEFVIVGTVSDLRTEDLTQTAAPEIYVSLWQVNAFTKDLVVATRGDAMSVATEVQRVLREVDPTVGIGNVRTMGEIRGDSLASRRFAMQLLVGFALLASVLTVGGIYGVLSLSVAARRREIAIRAAVGASRSSVLRLVMGDGLKTVGAGVGVGLILAIALSRILQTFLFGVEPTDPPTLLAVAVLFTAVAAVACWVPARRATSVDPVEALRDE